GENKIQAVAGPQRVPVVFKLAETVSDARQLRLGELNMRQCERVVEFRGVQDWTLAAFEFDDSDDVLGGLRIGRNPAAGPRRTEVGDVPTGGDESVKPEAMLEHRLNGVVSEIMQRKEARAILLHGDRAIHARTHERIRTVAPLLELDLQNLAHNATGSVSPISIYMCPEYYHRARKSPQYCSLINK